MMRGGLNFPDPEEQRELVQQEIREDANEPTALRVFYIVVASIFLLLLIVGILGANVFHFW